MKGLTRRGNIYWFRGTVDGKLKQWSLETSDEAEAIQRHRTRLAERHMAAMESPDWSKAVADFIAYKKEMGNSRAHLKHQRLMLTKTGIEMDRASPRDVTTADVVAWTKLRANPRTRMMLLEMLSRWFRWLVDTRRIRSNPCDAVERPRNVPKAIRRRFLSREDAGKLLTHPCGDDLRFALFCALHAGLRKGEVCAARPGWFDLKAGLLHITADAEWSAKDGDNRTIPLTVEFRAFLKDYGLRSPWMLRPEKKPGKHTYRVELDVPFKKHLKECGITNCTFHDLRRTFASLYLSDGGSIWLMSRWLGDGVEVVERHYGHLAHGASDIGRAWTKKPLKPRVKRSR